MGCVVDVVDGPFRVRLDLGMVLRTIPHCGSGDAPRVKRLELRDEGDIVEVAVRDVPAFEAGHFAGWTGGERRPWPNVADADVATAIVLDGLQHRQRLHRRLNDLQGLEAHLREGVQPLGEGVRPHVRLDE